MEAVSLWHFVPRIRGPFRPIFPDQFHQFFNRRAQFNRLSAEFFGAGRIGLSHAVHLGDSLIDLADAGALLFRGQGDVRHQFVHAPGFRENLV
jgi:hypothetical protein